jgi:hypothetical protein
VAVVLLARVGEHDRGRGHDGLMDGHELGEHGPAVDGVFGVVVGVCGEELTNTVGVCQGSLPPTVNLYRSCVGFGWLA